MSGNLQKSNLKLKSENGNLTSHLNIIKIEWDSWLNFKKKKKQTQNKIPYLNNKLKISF